ENSLRVLGATARRQLVLSYSGEGRPTTLRNLPQELLDDRTGRAAAAGLDSVLIPGPGSGGEDDESPHDAVGSARAVLKLRVSDSARSKRLLSAQEEVGLAQLMRGGPDRDLSAELPRGFRGQLAGGDERARAFDAMVLHNLGLVWSNVRPHLGSDLGEEDLKQHGVLGLMRAIEKWDGTRGLKFSTYATHWINQSMGRAVPDEGRVIRIPVHKYEVVRKVARTEQALLRELQEPTVANIAHRAGLSLPEVVECLRLAHGIVSLDKPLGSDGDDLTLADVLPLSFEDDANPDHVVDREMGAALVRQAMSTLRERDRMVLRMRHGFENDGEPMTLEKIGEHFSLTRERIRQIESKALPKLKAKLVEFGLQPGVSDSLPVKKRKSRGGTCTGQPLPPGDGPQSPGVELATGSDLVSRFGVTDEDSTVTGLLVALVDRARLSGARRVEVRTSGRGTSWALALGHDGVPFAGAVLREALCAVAAPSSGSAALGMAAVLYDEVAAWDVASGRECSLLTSAPGTNTWWLHRAQREIPDGLVPKQWTGPWSVLLLRAPRLQVARARMDVVLENCVRELGVVFGELLGSGFSIEVNGIAVTAQDPFLWNNPAGQHLGEEVVSAAGRWAVVSPRVLPHPDALRPGDSSSVGNPEEWRRSPGFYVRGDGRYLSCGGWLGLDGLDMAEGTALARVLVDLEFGELAAWGEDRPGARIAPPEPLRPRLAALARLAREKSELVMGRQRSRGTA
ncbi:sigma-70 family RNA polymerase sigma factor, partial [Actinosynnema sp.]|uniref:sigma-70 family RNA polymerase sigma factor n=1 Tax=Actinosynnema sp. TaxID=1872144 RepID=UPI003F859B21